MRIIKIFEESYCDDLRREIKRGDLSRFGKTAFSYDEERELATNIQIADDALDPIVNCDKKDLFTASRLLFETFPDLSGIQASYDPFWIHLSLVELYGYMIKAYPDIASFKSQYAFEHFLMGKFNAYNLCGMWWAVKMTVRSTTDGANDYTLTKFLLDKNSQLTQSLVESQLFRCRGVTTGVIEYFMENPSDCTSSLIKEAMKYLNMLGAIKQLASLRADYIKSELERQMPLLRQKNARIV